MDHNITNITVDLATSNNFGIVKAVQGDRGTRWVHITLLDNQVEYNFGKCYPVLRGTKPDDTTIFNKCTISEDNKIIVELTEQILAYPGMSVYEIALYATPVEITDKKEVITSFPFSVFVCKAGFNPHDVTSSDEFTAIADVMGDALFLKECLEDISNSRDAAKVSENNAKTSEINAKNSETAAKNSEISSENSYMLSKSYAVGTNNVVRPNDTTDNSKYYSEQSKNQAVASATSAAAAATSEQTAIQKATESADSATLSRSWAVGDTKTRSGETTDNAKYYSEQSKAYADSWKGSLLPKGTILFAQLPAINNVAGHMYNILDAFETDSRFKDGAGYAYPAGTNVYWTVDGKWDCLSGALTMELTMAEYNALSETQKMNGTIYYILDADNSIPLATENQDGLMSHTDKAKLDGLDDNVCFFGLCSTDANVSQKTVVTAENFKLKDGVRLCLFLTKGNEVTSNISFNVNNTGDIPVYSRYVYENDESLSKYPFNSGISTTNIYLIKNIMYEFIYKSGFWQLMNHDNGYINYSNAYKGISVIIEDKSISSNSNSSVSNDHQKTGEVVFSSCAHGLFPVHLGGQNETDAWSYNLGCSSFHWGQLFANKSTIITSDRNLKKDITALDSQYINLFDSINFKKFVLNGGADTLTTTKNQRYHLGVIAQEVEKTVKSLGLTSDDFSGVCSEYFACYGSYKATIHGGWRINKEGRDYSDNVFSWKHRTEKNIEPYEIYNEIIEEEISKLNIDSYRKNIGYILIEDNSKLRNDQPPITINNISFIDFDDNVTSMQFTNFLRYYNVDDINFDNPLSNVLLKKDGSATIEFNRMYGGAMLKLSSVIDISKYKSVMVDVDYIGEYTLTFIPDGEYHNANPYDRDRNDQILYNYSFRYDELFNLAAYTLQKTREEFNEYKANTDKTIMELENTVNKLIEKVGK